MELCSRGSFVKVQVAAKDFISALAGHHDLEAQGLDAPGQQIHRHCSSHLRACPYMTTKCGPELMAGGNLQLMTGRYPYPDLASLLLELVAAPAALPPMIGIGTRPEGISTLFCSRSCCKGELQW